MEYPSYRGVKPDLQIGDKPNSIQAGQLFSSVSRNFQSTFGKDSAAIKPIINDFLLNIRRDETFNQQMSHDFLASINRNNLARGQLYQLTLKQCLTTDQQTEIEAMYPEFNFIYAGTDNSDHYYARTQRICQVTLLLYLFNYDPTDLPTDGFDVVIKNYGGNPINALYDVKLNMHCCFPNLSYDDAVRHNSFINSLKNAAANAKNLTYHQNIKLKMYLDNNINHICRRKAQNCDVKSDKAIAIHSAYDMTVKDQCLAMQKGNTTQLRGVIHFTPDVFLLDEGCFKSTGMLFKKYLDKTKGVIMIQFWFPNDPQNAYRHEYLTYIEKFKTFSVVLPSKHKKDPDVYLYSITHYRGDSAFYHIVKNVCGTIPKSNPARVFTLPCTENMIVIYYYQWKSFFDGDKLSDSIGRLKDFKIKPLRLLVPKSLFEKTYQYGISLPAGKLTIQNLRVAATTFNTREVHGGVASTQQLKLAATDIIHFVEALFLIIYINNYECSKVSSRIKKGIDSARESPIINMLKRGLRKVVGATYSHGPLIQDVVNKNVEGVSSEPELKWFDKFAKFFDTLTNDEPRFALALDLCPRFFTIEEDLRALKLNVERRDVGHKRTEFTDLIEQSDRVLAMSDSLPVEEDDEIEYYDFSKFNFVECACSLIKIQNDGRGDCIIRSTLDSGIEFDRKILCERLLKNDLLRRIRSDGRDLNDLLTMYTIHKPVFPDESKFLPVELFFVIADEYDVTICLHMNDGSYRYGNSEKTFHFIVSGNHVDFAKLDGDLPEIFEERVKFSDGYIIDVSKLDATLKQIYNLWENMKSLRTANKSRLNKKLYDESCGYARECCDPMSFLKNGNYESRSGLKTAEMLYRYFGYDFASVLSLGGPGGEVRALLERTTAYIYGFTLTKFNDYPLSLQCDRFRQILGYDMSGDIFIRRNHDEIVDTIREAFPEGVCCFFGDLSLISDTGTFDLEAHHRESLLVGEEYILMRRTLKIGGDAYFKVFEIQSVVMNFILNHLVKNFNSVKVVKLLTSRPASTELHLICQGYLVPGEHAFIGIETPLDDVIKFFDNKTYLEQPPLISMNVGPIIDSTRKAQFENLNLYKKLFSAYDRNNANLWTVQQYDDATKVLLKTVLSRKNVDGLHLGSRVPIIRRPVCNLEMLPLNNTYSTDVIVPPTNTSFAKTIRNRVKFSNVKKLIHWDSLLSNKTNSKLVYTYLFSGLSFDDRQNFYRYLLHHNNRTPYNCVAERNRQYDECFYPNENFDHQIKIDLVRTRPLDLSYCEGEINYNACYRILTCFSNCYPHIGYIQGYNFIVASLLNQFEPGFAFKIFCFLFIDCKYCEIYDKDFQGFNNEVQMIKRSMEINYPVLYQRFLELGIPLDSFLCNWVVTIFSSNPSVDITSRILDVIAYEGDFSILRDYILYLFHSFMKDILNMDHDSCLNFLQGGIFTRLEKHDIKKHFLEFHRFRSGIPSLNICSTILNTCVTVKNKIVKTFTPEVEVVEESFTPGVSLGITLTSGELKYRSLPEFSEPVPSAPTETTSVGSDDHPSFVDMIEEFLFITKKELKSILSNFSLVSLRMKTYPYPDIILQSQKGNYGLIRNDKFVVEPKERSKSYVKVYSVSEAKLIPYSSMERNHDYLVSDDLIKYFGPEIIDSILASNYKDFDFTAISCSMIQAGPGTGKTTSIVNNFKAESTTVLLSTNEGHLDFKQRICKKYNLKDDYIKDICRTLASYIINSDRNKPNETLYIDEALMHHCGAIALAIVLTPGIKSLFCVGDVKQIPHVNRIAEYEVKYVRISDYIPVSSVLYKSYRCPVDVAYRLNNVYLEHNQQHGVDKGMTSVRNIINSCQIIKISSIQDVPKEEGVQYLTFTQAEKAQLKDKGLPNVSTVHEFQGKESQRIFVVRLNALPMENIFLREEYALVALTRHSKSLKYYTKITTDALCKLIRVDGITITEYASPQEIKRSLELDLGYDYFTYLEQPNVICDFKSFKTTSLSLKKVKDFKLVFSDSTRFSASEKTVYLKSKLPFNQKIRFEILRLSLHDLNDICKTNFIREIVFSDEVFDTINATILSQMFYKFVPGVRFILSSSKPPSVPNEVFEFSNKNTLPMFQPTSLLPEVITLEHFEPEPFKSHNQLSIFDVQSFLDNYFGSLNYVDQSLDSYMLETSDIQFEASDIKTSVIHGVYKFDAFDFMSPVLKTVIPKLRNNNRREMIVSFNKRNNAVPNMIGCVDIESVSDKMIEGLKNCFRPGTFNNVTEIYSTVGGVINWLETQKSFVPKQLESDFCVFNEPVNFYNFSIKRTAKPDLTLDSTKAYIALQTIVYHEKHINAYFCDIFRQLKRKILDNLHPHISFMTDLSLEGFVNKLNRDMPFPNFDSSVFAFFSGDDSYIKTRISSLELDISKFDKSQWLLDLVYECKWMSLFGVSDSDVLLWFNGHVLTRVYNRSTKLSANIFYQRKSGDASTYLGNTMKTMGSIAFFVDFSPCSFPFEDLNRHDLSMRFPLLFNLEIKIFRFVHPYFCSKFFGINEKGWWFIPDPVKLLTKLGRSDLVNPMHVQEAKRSFLDLVKSFDDFSNCLSVAQSVSERYSLQYDYTSFFHALPSLGNIFDDLFVIEPGSNIDFTRYVFHNSD